MEEIFFFFTDAKVKSTKINIKLPLKIRERKKEKILISNWKNFFSHNFLFAILGKFS